MDPKPTQQMTDEEMLEEVRILEQMAAQQEKEEKERKEKEEYENAKKIAAGGFGTFEGKPPLGAASVLPPSAFNPAYNPAYQNPYQPPQQQPYPAAPFYGVQQQQQQQQQQAAPARALSPGGVRPTSPSASVSPWNYPPAAAQPPVFQLPPNPYAPAGSGAPVAAYPYQTPMHLPAQAPAQAQAWQPQQPPAVVQQPVYGAAGGPGGPIVNNANVNPNPPPVNPAYIPGMTQTLNQRKQEFRQRELAKYQNMSVGEIEKLWMAEVQHLDDLDKRQAPVEEQEQVLLLIDVLKEAQELAMKKNPVGGPMPVPTVDQKELDRIKAEKQRIAADIENLNKQAAKIDQQQQDAYRVAVDDMKVKMAQIDLCIIMDCTISMTPFVDAAKKTLVDLVGYFAEGNAKDASLRNYRLRLSFVGYRDIHDRHHWEIKDFTEEAKEFQKFITNIVAKTSSDPAWIDIPEDLTGALDKGLKQSWKAITKLTIVVADSPCHGSKYHENDIEDKYPNGTPGLNVEDLIAEYRKRGIDLFFFDIHPSCSKMLRIFKKVYDEGATNVMRIAKLGSDPAMFKPAIIQSVTQSVHRKAGQTLAGGGAKREMFES